MERHTEYWFETAEYDFETAKAMLETKRYLYVGFMCQQTIEKALKGVIARSCAEGDAPPKIHNLLKLALRARLLDSMSDVQQELLTHLNPLNIEARYPSYKEQAAKMLSSERCRDILKRTEELLCWIKTQ